MLKVKQNLFMLAVCKDPVVVTTPRAFTFTSVKLRFFFFLSFFFFCCILTAGVGEPHRCV